MPLQEARSRIAFLPAKFFDCPGLVIEALDREAARMGVTHQSIIKMWLGERLERTEGVSRGGISPGSPGLIRFSRKIQST